VLDFPPIAFARRTLQIQCRADLVVAVSALYAQCLFLLLRLWGLVALAGDYGNVEGDAHECNAIRIRCESYVRRCWVLEWDVYFVCFQSLSNRTAFCNACMCTKEHWG